MPDRPIEILALPQKLHELFDGLVPPKTGGNHEQNERDFLSRALAAYAIHKLGGAPCPDAASAIVDGGGDGGIDGVYFSPANNVLWLVQSKYVHSGLNEPDLGEVTKFRTGVENLLAGRFDVFADNAQWTAIRPKIETVFRNHDVQVRAVLCYSGILLISEDRKRLFETLKERVSRDEEDEYFNFISVNLTTLHDWLTGGDDSPGIDSVELEILCPGHSSRPYETIYGLVTLEQLKVLHQEHGERLIRSNIRGFKGRTEVNKIIQKTLTEDAKIFHYLNNGLTAYCDRFEVYPPDRADWRCKRITARGLAVINGAQTLGSIGQCVGPAEAGAEPTGYAFIKIISLERCEDDRAFAERISRAANFQNQVGLKDFAAAYPLHEQMRLTLKPHGIWYHYRLDDETPEPDETNFTIEEALTACACLHNAQDCDFVTRVAANRDSLRSLELVFPAAELLRSRHERVFPANLSARTVWRAVQTQRIVVKGMANSAKASTGTTKAFYTYARWIVLAAIFNRIKPEIGEALALSDEEQRRISSAVSDYAEELLAQSVAKGFAGYEAAPGGQQVLIAPRDFQSVFKTQGDCQTLFSALRAEIWKDKHTADTRRGEGRE